MQTCLSVYSFHRGSLCIILTKTRRLIYNWRNVFEIRLKHQRHHTLKILKTGILSSRVESACCFMHVETLQTLFPCDSLESFLFVTTSCHIFFPRSRSKSQKHPALNRRHDLISHKRHICGSYCTWHLRYSEIKRWASPVYRYCSTL